MNTSLPALAFAGIGLMGLPMCRRLLAAGYPLSLWNRNADKCLPLLQDGCQRVQTPAELCRDAELVLLCLALDRFYDRPVRRYLAKRLVAGASTSGIEPTKAPA